MAGRPSYSHDHRRGGGGGRHDRQRRRDHRSRSRSRIPTSYSGRPYEAPHQSRDFGGDSSEEALLNFREFINNSQADEVDPQLALERYERYKEEFAKRNARRFFSRHKESGFLVERYRPDFVRSRIQQMQDASQHIASVFFKLLEENRLEGINLVAPHSEQGQIGINQREVTLSLDASFCSSDPPYCVADPTIHSLILPRIPFQISKSDISPFLQDIPGVVDFTLLPPVPGGTREGFIRFESSEQCYEAERLLSQKEVKEGFYLEPVVSIDTKEYRVRITPAIAWRPSRIRSDLQKSAALIRKLDLEAEITQLIEMKARERGEDALHPLLDSPSSKHRGDVAQLDLQIVYLRRVHNLCYYSAERYESEREAWETAGAVYLRPYIHQLQVILSKTTEEDELEKEIDQLVGGEEKERENTWALATQHKVEQLLAAPFDIPPEITADSEEVVKRWGEFCTENTLEVEAEKWRCAICNKLFRGAEFVHKHLKNKHYNALDQIVHEVSEDYMWESYLNDPKKVYFINQGQRSHKRSRDFDAMPRGRTISMEGSSDGRGQPMGGGEMFYPSYTDLPPHHSAPPPPPPHYGGGYGWGSSYNGHHHPADAPSGRMSYDTSVNEFSNNTHRGGNPQRGWGANRRFYDLDAPGTMEVNLPAPTSSTIQPNAVVGNLRATIRYDDL